MAGYRIISETSGYKKKAVQDIEAVCPICHRKHTEIMRQDLPFGVQNEYECLECGTKWKGNIYTKGWDKATPESAIMANKGFIIAALACTGTALFLFLFIGIPAFRIMLTLVPLLLVFRIMEFKFTGMGVYTGKALGYLFITAGIMLSFLLMRYGIAFYHIF